MASRCRLASAIVHRRHSLPRPTWRPRPCCSPLLGGSPLAPRGRALGWLTCPTAGAGSGAPVRTGGAPAMVVRLHQSASSANSFSRCPAVRVPSTSRHGQLQGQCVGVRDCVCCALRRALCSCCSLCRKSERSLRAVECIFTSAPLFIPHSNDSPIGTARLHRLSALHPVACSWAGQGTPSRAQNPGPHAPAPHCCSPT